jgi:hypothetical protein
MVLGAAIPREYELVMTVKVLVVAGLVVKVLII